MARVSHASPKNINHVITKNLQKLNKPGVLTVRPGYEIANHMLTGKSAVVATVHTKKPDVDLDEQDRLPDQINGIPVDVREATAHQRLRAVDPGSAAVVAAYARPEEREPEWPDEREMPSGKLLTSDDSYSQRTLKKARASQPATDAALKRRTGKKHLAYEEPTNAPALVARDITSTVTASISPDSGFETLQTFLEGTRQSLVVGMYDFTSGPILALFLKVLASQKSLQMVLDNPSTNPTADQTDWITVETLNNALKARCQITRALAGDDQFAAAAIFPTSYHIKVIVRDNTVLWLSSGNLNNSNEPDLSRPPHTEDRDWHVIIEDAPLALLFAAYIKYDYQVAAENQEPNPDTVERAIEAARAKKAREENPPPPHPAPPLKNPVAAQTFPGIPVTVTPLLTPDKINGKYQYYSNIMSLIQSATKSINIQLQYIEASEGQGTDYDKLLQALLDKSKDIPVQLIVSADYAEKNQEKMKAQGVDLTDLIRTQPSVHNKGFIIDGAAVVVSSQNFSPDGIELNRDAGLIMKSPELAKYFGAAFESDWSITKPMSLSTKTSTKRASPVGRASRSTQAKRQKKPTWPRPDGRMPE